MTPESIKSCARTVAHLATYFEELKQTARGLRDQFAARQRGYFTPSEDEAVRRLLISYWQARNALFDLVVSYRDYATLPADVRPAAFLVAYAAAILLVDAARFLREMYNDCPAIVTKLNEPEPHFGIPPGTYDTVQESLTNPKNVWHLYHAVQYFTQHERELRDLAGDEMLVPVIAVIDRLGHRMQVSAYDYASARLRVRAQLAQSGLRWTLIERALYGLQKIACLMVSDVHTRHGHRPGLPPGVADELRGLLQPGDVLVTRKDHVMTNYFLPGYWPHAALFLGDSAAMERLGIHEHPDVRPRWPRLLAMDAAEPRRVLEALKDGVWIRSLSSPFASDAIAALRPRLSQNDVAQAIARGMFHEGKSYDFDFDFTRSDRLVCTEVVYRSYEGIGGVRFELNRRAGRLTLAAEDLLRMALEHKWFEPLAVFAPTQATHLLRGGDADIALRTTMGQ
jgi:hypothetical protein